MFAYKWYKKLFLRLILQCALSAHKLYKLKDGKLDFLHFLHDVCSELLMKSPKLTRTAKLDSVCRLTERNHFPAKRQYEVSHHLGVEKNALNEYDQYAIYLAILRGCKCTACDITVNCFRANESRHETGKEGSD